MGVKTLCFLELDHLVHLSDPLFFQRVCFGKSEKTGLNSQVDSLTWFIFKMQGDSWQNILPKSIGSIVLPTWRQSRMIDWVLSTYDSWHLRKSSSIHSHLSLIEFASSKKSINFCITNSWHKATRRIGSLYGGTESVAVPTCCKHLATIWDKVYCTKGTSNRWYIYSLVIFHLDDP